MNWNGCPTSTPMSSSSRAVARVGRKRRDRVVDRLDEVGRTQLEHGIRHDVVLQRPFQCRSAEPLPDVHRRVTIGLQPDLDLVALGGRITRQPPRQLGRTGPSYRVTVVREVTSWPRSRSSVEKATRP